MKTQLAIYLILIFMHASGASGAAIARGTSPVGRTRATMPNLVQIDSIGLDEICGADQSGQTVCTKGGPESTKIPDTVGTLSKAFANDILGCGIDVDGYKCWKLTATGTSIGGIESSKAFRSFFSSSQPDSVRLSSYNVCGVQNTSGELLCLVPYWYRTSKYTFSVKPKNKITAVSLTDDVVCWADSTATDSVIDCRSDSASSTSPWPWASGVKFSSLIELSVGQASVCARSKTEAKCWSRGGAIQLPTDMVTAKTWSAASDGLCALTRDSRIVCVDPLTGSVLPSSLGHSIPADYVTPNPDIQAFRTSDVGGCVLNTAGKVACWEWWNPGAASEVDFSSSVVSMFGASSQPCAILSNGQAECRGSTVDSVTLKNTDRVHVEFGGYNKCFWNSSGVDCRGRTDNLSYRSVKDLSAAQNDEAICVVGVPSADATGFDSVQCLSYNPELKSPPSELRNPVSVATNADQACALSDEGLTCWGTPYEDVTVPTTVVSATRLVMSGRHACVLDQFGLVCWGELNTLALTIPPGLDQPGRVVDVAVGKSVGHR